MKSARIILGGLAAVLSLQITPAFAKPAMPGYNTGTKPNNGSGYNTQPSYNTMPAYDNSYGYQTKRARFDEELELAVLDLINAVRYKQGLSELRTDSRALKASRLLAREAGQEGGFEEISQSLSTRLQAQGLDLSRRAYGESRALLDEDEDVNLMARKIVRKWLKSPKFSQVLLSQELSYAGVAAYISAEGEVTVVLNAFGAERKPEPPPHGCGG